MQLDWLYRIARSLHYQGLKPQEVLRTALSLAGSAVEVTQGCILAFEDDGSLREAYLLGGDLDNQQELWERLLSQGIVGFVQHSQRTVNIRNISTDPRWPRLSTPWAGSAVGVPLMHQNQVIGALLLIHSQIDYFRDDISDFLEEAAGLIAVAYENAYTLEQAQIEAEMLRVQLDHTKPSLDDKQNVEQLRSDLAAMTYHDLRGLLHNINSALCGLERSMNGDKTAAALLRLATQSTRQMTRMVKGLLDIDRLEQGSGIANKRSLTMRTVMEEVVELLRPIASEADQILTCTIFEPLPTVEIDADMVSRVVANLIENAIKHTPAGGHIEVCARLIDQTVQVSVSDTGPGIPAKYQKDIFDKYYRLRHSETRDGVGLGLAFCRLAVEAHGGRIWVDNQPGSGAVFNFTLPAETTTITAARQA